MQNIKPGLREVFRVFAKIGLLSFGGPAAQIGMLQHVLVDEKKWLDQQRFIHALNFCMLLPGPEAMQLATYSGWAVAGWRGGLMAGLLFVLPGALVMLALSAAYVAFGQVTIVAGLLFGLRAAVLVIVLDALYRMSKRSLRSAFAVCIAIAAFLAIVLFKVPFPIIVIVAACAGGLHHVLFPHRQTPTEPSPLQAGAFRQSVQQLLIWGSLWLLPLLIILAAFGIGHVFSGEAIFFSKLAAVSFGGAYAALTYTAQEAVQHFGWMQPGEMLTGLGLAETTPGPLILVLVFVGFVGAAQLAAWPPLLGGLMGGLIALWFTFIPCFLWIFVGAPFIEHLRQVKWLSAFLGGITAAVIGVIANLSLWFALHVIFADVGTYKIGPVELPVPDLASIENAAVLIAGAAALFLWVFRLNMPLVLLLAACIGALIRLLV